MGLVLNFYSLFSKIWKEDIFNYIINVLYYPKIKQISKTAKKQDWYKITVQLQDRRNMIFSKLFYKCSSGLIKGKKIGLLKLKQDSGYKMTVHDRRKITFSEFCCKCPDILFKKETNCDY